MGKWTALMKGKAAYNGIEPKYQDRVDVVKSTLQSLSPSDIAGRVADLRSQKAEKENELAEINLRLEANHQVLIDVYDQAGVDSLKLTSGHSVRTQVEPYAAVRDKEAYRKWAIANGYQSIMMVPWQTTNSITKDRLQEGEPEPDGVEIYARTKVVLTSPRKGQ